MINTFIALLLPFSFASNQTFERPCFIAGEDDMLTSKIQIVDATWTITHTAYVDESCKESYLIFETKSKVKQDRQNIDMTALEVSYISTREDVTRALNEIAFCDLTNWKTNARQIVTGHQCQDFAAPKKGQVIHSIFEVNEHNGQVEAFIGAPTLKADGSSPEKRHVETESQPYYLKR